MKDPISFQKLGPWCQLGMPTILGHPNKVNEFFSKFYGKELNSDQDKITYLKSKGYTHNHNSWSKTKLINFLLKFNPKVSK